MNRETRKHVQAAEEMLDSQLSFFGENPPTAIGREIVMLIEAFLEAITALKSDLIDAEEKIAGASRVLAIGARAAGVDTDPDPQACPTCLQMADDYKGSHEAGWTFICPSGHEWSDTRDVAPEPEPEPEGEPEGELGRCPTCSRLGWPTTGGSLICSGGHDWPLVPEPEPEPDRGARSRDVLVDEFEDAFYPEPEPEPEGKLETQTGIVWRDCMFCSSPSTPVNSAPNDPSAPSQPGDEMHGVCTTCDRTRSGVRS